MNILPRRQLMQLYDLATDRQLVKRLDSLRESQWRSHEDLAQLQREKLHDLLLYAYKHVPYYQRQFHTANFHPGDVLIDINTLRNLPLIDKDTIRQNFDEMITTQPDDRDALTPLRTGGSTGKPLIFKQDVAFRDFVTADIYRHLAWGGWQLGDVQGYLWGAAFEAKKSKEARTRLMDWVLNRFLVNAFLLSEEGLESFAKKVRHYRPKLIFCYPSSLYRFAEYCQQKGYDDITFESMFTSAEVIYPQQRTYIEETFGGKVFNRYGTRELGGIACECEAHTDLHVSMENIVLEILDDEGNPCAPGEVGNIVVTNLNNHGMPFIRYRLGDLGSWSEHTSCPCGRNLPMMQINFGRAIDMFPTRHKGLVWPGFAGLFGIKGVAQFQIVQKSLDLVVARIVKDGEVDRDSLAHIARSMKKALGDHVEVRFEYCDKIDRVQSGKFRYAISEVNRKSPTPEEPVAG